MVPKRAAVARPPARGWWAPLCLAVAVAGFVVTLYPGALGLPLVTDDYLILHKVRDASFLSLWSRSELLSGFYRPWARELHYWTLFHRFGAEPLPFHLACFLLWFGIVALYFVLVRRLAGTAAAALAACLALTMAPWGVLLIWSAGAQDLWMMGLALLSLVMFSSGRVLWASLTFALSLLSKETAATLPAIAALYAWIVERMPLRATLRRTAPLWGIVIAWALFHPMLGGRLGGGPAPAPPPPGWEAPAPAARLVASLGTIVNAGFLPRPADGWRQVLVTSLPAAALLVATVLAGLRAGAAPGDAPGTRAAPARVGAWAAAWALLGWLPLLMPGVGFQPYYALWGGLGAWCALSIGLARWRIPAVLTVIALSFLRTASAWTPQTNMGSEWYQTHSAAVTEAVHRDLREHRASFPPHSRVFLAGVPGGAGLLPAPGHCPALEVWYSDPTLRGYFFSQYAPRAASDTLGGDFFFVFGADGRSTEIIRGPEDLERAREDPAWLSRHLELASTLFSKGDRRACAEEFEKMTQAYPTDPALWFDLGACYESLGEHARAEACDRNALALPGATPEMRAIARRDWGTAP